MFGFVMNGFVVNSTEFDLKTIAIVLNIKSFPNNTTKYKYDDFNYSANVFNLQISLKRKCY